MLDCFRVVEHPFMKAFSIGNRLIGDGHPPYIIAEACINHGGCVDIAKEMVYHAKAAQVDAIKFQYHVLDDEMLRDTPQSANFEFSLYKTLEETNLSLDEHLELQSLCNSLGLDYMCTPFSKASADILDEQLKLQLFKVGSGECTNHPLQSHIASKNKPMVVSTGMTELSEVDDVVALLKQQAKFGFAITHCVSAYPCPYDRVNLDLIPFYRDRYNIPVGLSDHSVGIYTSIGAVALGACIIEKHFSLDRTEPGPDHLSSIEPYELGELVRGCRAVWLARGCNREIFPEEKEIVAWARESVVSVCPISSGTVISKDMVTVKRPSPTDGVVPAKFLSSVIGSKAEVNIPANIQILWESIESNA